MSRGRAARRAAVPAALAVAVGAELVARRIEGARRDPIGLRSEAAFKLQRLRDLQQQRRSPKVLFIGASVLDADIDPRVVDGALGLSRATFNACLTGSDLDTMRRWWRMIRTLVSPDLVVVEAHPGMMLPPGTMADKLSAHLDALGAHLAAEAAPTRPALPAAVAAGWPRTRRALLDSFGADRPRSGDPGAPARNDVNGHLGVYQDVPFDVGSKQLGDDDWYELVRIDLSARWRHDDYFDVVEEVRRQVPAVLVAVSPLLLGAAPATARRAEIPSAISDATVAEATVRGLPVVDLRRWAHDREDFADPFHLRTEAVGRVSRAAAESLRPLLGS